MRQPVFSYEAYAATAPLKFFRALSHAECVAVGISSLVSHFDLMEDAGPPQRRVITVKNGVSNPISNSIEPIKITHSNGGYIYEVAITGEKFVTFQRRIGTTGPYEC